VRKCLRSGLTLSVVTIAAVVLSIGCLPAAALAAEPSAAAAVRSETDASAAAEAASTTEVDELQDQIDHLDSFVSLLLLPLTILVGLLAGGGVIGLITSLRYERRQTQLHDLAVTGETASQERAGEIHALTVSGETAAQERATESHLKFLNDSHETLTLVNDTLRLAKEASERAEKAIEEKAAERLKEIDRDAKEVLSEALDRGDFKVVVRDPWTEERLNDVAERVRGIEGFADAHGLELSPDCLFAKGLDRHLNSAPESAIDSWCKAAERAANTELAALARFWVGYERNNIGQFQKAAKAFRLARELHMSDKDQAQYYELSRMEIQSRFFDTAKENFRALAERRGIVEEFVVGLDRLLESLDPSRRDFQGERGRCEETVGEMLVWAARLSPLERPAGEPFSDDERTSLAEATGRFERAGDLVWARFGKAQVRWALGDELEKPEYESLLMTLMAEAGSHREPRTLALRHAAILVAEGEHHDAEEVLDRAYRDLWNDVHHIGGRLTVFSPWQKRNVTLEQFKDEVQAYRDSSR
jgi:tetratricopeptide (TPR) repeat protein